MRLRWSSGAVAVSSEGAERDEARAFGGNRFVAGGFGQSSSAKPSEVFGRSGVVACVSWVITRNRSTRFGVCRDSRHVG
jgi:hypothetical protein